MTKYADLHVHTHYSDSTFSPDEVIYCAGRAGLSAIAICDHDSVKGIPECIKTGRKHEIEIIPAVEITAEKKNELEVHILGYLIDWEDKKFIEKIARVQKARIARVYEMAKKLKDMDIEIDPKKIIFSAGEGTVTRLHVAQAIMKTGKVKSYRTVFEKYIGYLKPAYVSYTKFSPKDAIDLILEAGGIPVLAHPATIGRDDFIPELVECGLKGIEVYHTDHDNAARRRYEDMAKKYNLLITGGSDCHGMGKGRILMGSVRVPYELVEKLKKENERIRS